MHIRAYTSTYRYVHILHTPNYMHVFLSVSILYSSFSLYMTTISTRETCTCFPLFVCQCCGVEYLLYCCYDLQCSVHVCLQMFKKIHA